MNRPRNALVAAVLGGSLLASGAASTFAASAHAQNHRARAYGQVHLVPGGFMLTRSLKHPRADGATTVKVQVQVPTNPAPKEIARKGTTDLLDEGDYALVVGTKSTTGLVASRVLYSDAPFKVHRSRAIGTVTAYTPGASLTIQTKKGKSLDFEITAQTRYRVNKQLQSAAPTFAQGERVAIRFTIDKATKHRLALVISVRPAKAPSATTP